MTRFHRKQANRQRHRNTGAHNEKLGAVALTDKPKRSRVKAHKHNNRSKWARGVK